MYRPRSGSAGLGSSLAANSTAARMRPSRNAKVASGSAEGATGRRVRLVLEVIARHRDREAADPRRAALLEDVGRLVGEQLASGRRVRLELARVEEDVA